MCTGQVLARRHHKPKPRDPSKSQGSAAESGPFCVRGVWGWHSGDLRPGLLGSRPAAPVGLMLHLFFTNFFLEALGFNRRLPAPRVLSRTCRVAERLEMSFSAKGDSPAM